MALKFTNFYLPGSKDRLRFIEDSSSSNSDSPEEEEKIPQQQNDNLLIFGFVDSWKENEQYIELVKKLNLDGLDLQQLSDSITQDMQI